MRVNDGERICTISIVEKLEEEDAESEESVNEEVLTDETQPE